MASRKNTAVPPGFLVSPKVKRRPLTQMTVRELQDLYDRNKRILSTPATSTSTYVDRISAEQAEIEARLIELEGVELIRTRLKNTKIAEEEDMNVDEKSEPVLSRTIDAKRRALSRFTPASPTDDNGNVASISLQEAIDLEQQAHARDLQRRQQVEEKKRRQGLPVKGELLTKKDREARIWAFMNYKPSDSDLEEDSDYDDDDDDPSAWFEDDQDDGRKGQDIIEPDAEDLSEVIRIDHSRIHYSTFYEPRDDDN